MYDWIFCLLGRLVLAAVAPSTIRSFFKPVPSENTTDVGRESSMTMVRIVVIQPRAVTLTCFPRVVQMGMRLVRTPGVMLWCLWGEGLSGLEGCGEDER